MPRKVQADKIIACRAGGIVQSFLVAKRIIPGLEDCNCLEGTICLNGDFQRGICPRAILVNKRKQQEIEMSKEESVKAAMGKFEDAVGAVYDAGVEEGKASMPAPVEQPPVAIPDPVSVDPTKQEDLDAAIAPFKAQIEELKAKLAEGDATPFAQKDIDDAVAKAKDELKAEMDKAEASSDEAEELIAQAMKDLAQKVSDLHAKKSAPAPAEGEAEAK